MGRYLWRRSLYALPILLGVNLLTFILFFVVNHPDDLARTQLGGKHVTAEAILQWKNTHGYAAPLLWNTQADGLAQLTQTIFWQKSLPLLQFEFGEADDGRAIGRDIQTRMGPSLALALPSFMGGLALNILLALVSVRQVTQAYSHLWVGSCVVLMSISTLFWLILGQFIVAKWGQFAPISGWSYGWESLRFVWLPILIHWVAGIGAGVRWYRNILLQILSQDYIRAARAKGLSDWQTLWRHVLPNAALPIVTGSVAQLPLLFMGSLLTEAFFGIPGLGSYTIDAIYAQDFAIVRAMVFLGAALYLFGLWLTDITYTLVDPRVRLT